MSDQATGFKIGDRSYAFPSRFRMGDAVLVKELTGLDFEDFAVRIDALNQAIKAKEAASDLLVVTGLVGVAVWQANERWTRDRARRFIENLDMAGFEIEGGAEEGAPLTAGAAPPQNPSPDESNEFTTTPVGSEAVPV